MRNNVETFSNSPEELRIAVLLPCYNCGKAVMDVVEGLRPYVKTILAVNDGSTDETAHYLRTAGVEQIGWVENRGKGRALLAGFHELLSRPNWDVLVTMDSDGQHAPHDLPRFVERYRETQADMIAGHRRFEQASVPWLRRWANRMSSGVIAALCRCPVHDIQCGYRLFSRRAIETMLPLLTSSAYSIETEMLLLALSLNLKINEVDIQCIYETESTSRSSWRPLTDSWHIACVVLRHLFSSRLSL